MRRTWRWLPLLALAGWLGWSQWSQGNEGLRVGTQAPNITVQRLDGKSLSLKDLRGKVVYLDFFATW